eukprot:SAG11_NODE_414_length_9684_cov_7.947522_1_plen_2392_part_00
MPLSLGHAAVNQGIANQKSGKCSTRAASAATLAPAAGNSDNDDEVDLLIADMSPALRAMDSQTQPDHLMHEFIPHPSEPDFAQGLHGSWTHSRKDWTRQRWLQAGFRPRKRAKLTQLLGADEMDELLVQQCRDEDFGALETRDDSASANSDDMDDLLANDSRTVVWTCNCDLNWRSAGKQGGRCPLTNCNSGSKSKRCNTHSSITLRGTIQGKTCHVLCDTGASVSFIDAAFVADNQLTTVPVNSPGGKIVIRLGDDHTCDVTQVAQVSLFLGDNCGFELNLLVMPLARGCDVIYGFDAMCKHDVWIHPASKRITAWHQGKRVVLAQMQQVTNADGTRALRHLSLADTDMQIQQEDGADAPTIRDILIDVLNQETDAEGNTVVPDETSPSQRIRNLDELEELLHAVGAHSTTGLAKLSAKQLQAAICHNESYRFRYQHVPDRLWSTVHRQSCAGDTQCSETGAALQTGDLRAIINDRRDTTAAAATTTRDITLSTTDRRYYERQKGNRCLIHALNNLKATTWVTAEQLEAVPAAKGHTPRPQTRYTGFKPRVLEQFMGSINVPMFREWTWLAKTRPTDWAPVLHSGAIIHCTASAHYIALATVIPQQRWRLVDSMRLPVVTEISTATALNAYMNGEEVKCNYRVVYVMPDAIGVGTHPAVSHSAVATDDTQSAHHSPDSDQQSATSAVANAPSEPQMSIVHQCRTCSFSGTSRNILFRHLHSSPQCTRNAADACASCDTADDTPVTAQHMGATTAATDKRTTFQKQKDSPREWLRFSSLPETPAELQEGIYATADPLTEIQNVSRRTMSHYMRLMRAGKLKPETCDIHMADIPNESDDDDDTASHDSQCQCAFQGCAGGDRCPRNNAATYDPDDENIFLATVQFHPDGTYTITGTPDASVCSTEATCSSMKTAGDLDWTGYRDITIAPHTLSNASSASADGPLRAGVPAECMSPDCADPLSRRKQKLMANCKQNEIWKRQGNISWNADLRTFRCFVAHGDEELVIEGKFPIDETSIDKTFEEMLKWTSDFLNNRLQHFKCFTELKRWEPLPGDPLLKIRLKPGCTPVSRRYPVPVHMYPEFKKFITNMLEMNFIIPSESSFTAPVIIIKKPPAADGTSRGWRFVTDFRSINECIQPPQYYVPDVQTMYEKLRGATFISTFDMKNGYWLAGVDPESTDLLAFSSPWGTFAYQVCPMGLVSSAAHFQNWVENKLRKHGVLLEYAPFIQQQQAAQKRPRNSWHQCANCCRNKNHAVDTTAHTLHSVIDAFSQSQTDHRAGWRDEWREAAEMEDLLDEYGPAHPPDDMDTVLERNQSRDELYSLLRQRGITDVTRLLNMEAQELHDAVCTNEGLRFRYEDTLEQLRKFAHHKYCPGCEQCFATYSDCSVCGSKLKQGNDLYTTAEMDSRWSQGSFQPEVHDDDLIWDYVPRPDEADFDETAFVHAVTRAHWTAEEWCAAGTRKIRQKHQLIPNAGFVATYADDLVCVSASKEEHITHLLKLATILSAENIYLNSAKSHVFCRYVRYLGAVAGNNVLLQDPAKVRSIVAMPHPKNSQREIRGFLGMASFWRRWIASYAKIVQPLNDLLKKGVDVKTEWSMAHDAAVITLKKALVAYPILRQFDPQLASRVITDASDYACGGILAQLHETLWHVVCYASRSFSGPEKNYSVQEKECLGVVYCVQKFRHYILCSKFRLSVQTDHSSLVFLSKPTNASGRIARWSMIMSEYDYQIEYIKGTSNVVADQLSRLIERQDDKWTSPEMDDDTTHPFLWVWPVLRLIGEMTTEGAQASMDSDEPPGWAEEEHRLNTMTDAPHEQLFFQTNARLTEQFRSDDSIVTFSSEAYLDCDDFSAIYEMLLLAASAKGNRPADEPASDDAVVDDPPLTQVQAPAAKPAASKHMQWTPAQRKLLSKYNKCFLENGYMYRMHQGRELLCVPNIVKDNIPVRFDIISIFHDPPWSGHRGVQYTYQALRRRFYWPGMRTNVEKFVSTCVICQMNKKNRRKPQGEQQSPTIPTTIGESYWIDYLTDLPESTEQKFNMAMIVVDRHSARVFMIPTWKRATGSVAAEQFHDEICSRAGRGVPREIISDRDVRFTKGFWNKWQTRLGVSLRFTSARTQHSNGGAERAIAVIEEIVLSYINYEQNNWVSLTPHLIFAINNSPSDMIGGRTPLYVEYGKHPTLPIDLHEAIRQDEVDQSIEDRVTRLENLRHDVHDTIVERRTRAADYYNANRRVASALIKPGAKAWLDLSGISLTQFNLRPSPKWNPVFYGPFVVLSQPSPNSFRLKLPEDARIHDVFHVARLRPHQDAQFIRRKSNPFPKMLRGEEEFEIERILDHDFKHGIQWYLISWKGWSEVYESTWETRSDLMKNARRIVLSYEKEKNISLEEPERRKTRKRK